MSRGKKRNYDGGRGIGQRPGVGTLTEIVTNVLHAKSAYRTVEP